MTDPATWTQGQLTRSKRPGSGLQVPRSPSTQSTESRRVVGFEVEFLGVYVPLLGAVTAGAQIDGDARAVFLARPFTIAEYGTPTR
jgi:hypothetical protein